MPPPIKKTNNSPVAKPLTAPVKKTLPAPVKSLREQDCQPPYHMTQWAITPGALCKPNTYDVRIKVESFHGGDDVLFVKCQGVTVQERAKSLKAAVLRLATMAEAIEREYVRTLG